MSTQRSVALEALRRYDVAPQRVRIAAESFNSIFRVATASAVYALRVGSAVRIHPQGTSAVEVAWHRRLRQQGVYVPAVVANVDGQFATLVPDGRAEHGPRTCVLFEWVAGRSLRTCLTGRRAAALGRLSARLQRHAVGWSPSGAGDVLRADRVLYWRLPDKVPVAGSRFGFGDLVRRRTGPRPVGAGLAVAEPAAPAAPCATLRGRSCRASSRLDAVPGRPVTRTACNPDGL